MFQLEGTLMYIPYLTLFAVTVVSAPAPTVQVLLDHAAKTHAARVQLPAGRVVVEKNLRLDKAEDLIIEGQGTTLVFSDHRGTGWSFRSCRNITLRNFAIDYDPLPFVQGRITSRSDDGKRYDFTVIEGYPGLRKEDAEHYRQAYVFESDRPRWKPWVPDLYARRVEIVDPRHGRFVMGYPPPFHQLLQVGDRIVLTIRSGSAIRMDGCENVRVDDVTFLAAPGAAYLARYLRGDNHYRYTIKPGPPPPGATEPRLISSCADGLNIAFATKGPLIEGCKFSFMGDDSVNLHGATLAVVERRNPTELLVAWPYAAEQLASVIRPGAAVRRLRPGNYEVLGTAKLTGFAPFDRPRPEHLEMIRKAWPRNPAGRGSVFRLTLAEPLSAEPGEFVDIPDSNAPGFVIRDCVFEDHRARGLRIMASHGVIERNIFRRLKMNAITVGAEYGFWREAGWTADVTIKDNIIEDVCRDAALLRSQAYVLGAISVFGAGDLPSPLPTWPGNRHIVIEKNTVRNCPIAGIFAAAVQGVQIRGNRLEQCLYRYEASAGCDRGLDVREVIDVRHARNADVSANEVVKAGEAPPAR